MGTIGQEKQGSVVPFMPRFDAVWLAFAHRCDQKFASISMKTTTKIRGHKRLKSE
jgi:hypothetical protein